MRERDKIEKILCNNIITQKRVSYRDTRIFKNTRPKQDNNVFLFGKITIKKKVFIKSDQFSKFQLKRKTIEKKYDF